jgi:hypothetical protein
MLFFHVCSFKYSEGRFVFLINTASIGIRMNKNVDAPEVHFNQKGEPPFIVIRPENVAAAFKSGTVYQSNPVLAWPSFRRWRELY